MHQIKQDRHKIHMPQWKSWLLIFFSQAIFFSHGYRQILPEGAKYLVQMFCFPPFYQFFRHFCFRCLSLFPRLPEARPAIVSMWICTFSCSSSLSLSIILSGSTLSSLISLGVFFSNFFSCCSFLL